MALAMQTIGLKPVSSAKGEEQFAAPLVSKGELSFDQWVAFSDFSQLCAHAFEGGFGCKLGLSGISCVGRAVEHA